VEARTISWAARPCSWVPDPGWASCSRSSSIATRPACSRGSATVVKWGVAMLAIGISSKPDDTDLVGHSYSAVDQPAENPESHQVVESNDRSHSGSYGKIGALLTCFKMRRERAELYDFQPLTSRTGPKPAPAFPARP